MVLMTMGNLKARSDIYDNSIPNMMKNKPLGCMVEHKWVLSGIVFDMVPENLAHV